MMNPSGLGLEPLFLLSISLISSLLFGSQTPFHPISSDGPTWITKFLLQFPCLAPEKVPGAEALP